MRQPRRVVDHFVLRLRGWNGSMEIVTLSRILALRSYFEKCAFVGDPIALAKRKAGKSLLPFFVNYTSAQLSELTDAALLQEAGIGDREAFRFLYRRISKALYSVAFKVTGNEADADELMQETFLELWKQAPKYDAKVAQPLTYASRIIRNRAIDRIRMKTRHGRIASESREDIVESTQSKPFAGAFEKLRSSEMAQVVRKAFDVLSEDQRQVLHLAYFGGLSQSEIAERESEALGTVKSRIRRGLEKLRAELEGKV